MNNGKKHSEFAYALSMISGFGISLITPIALCLFVALKLKEKFDLSNSVVVFAVILGAASSVWTMVKLIKSISNSRKDE